MIGLLAALLALSLGITAALLYFFWPRRTINTASSNQVVATNTNRPADSPTATPQASSPTPTATPTSTPRPTLAPDEPDEPDEPRTGTDPGSTKITFGPGRDSSTVSGEVWRQRTYRLWASAGQRLDARINSPDDCASFSNGDSAVRFPTEPGNNVLTVVNQCEGDAAAFSLTVSIR